MKLTRSIAVVIPVPPSLFILSLLMSMLIHHYLYIYFIIQLLPII
jgi:hypothetical protein